MRAGAELVNPATGSRALFRETAGDTGGQLLQFERLARPGWTACAGHLHPRQEERIEVLSGVLGLRVEGLERVLGPGDVVVVKPGSPHSAWNAGPDALHLIIDFRPALRTEVLLETLATLGRDGKLATHGMPRNPLLAALALRHFADEFQFAWRPAAIRSILPPLAALGRVLGYRAEHRYTDEEAGATR